MKDEREKLIESLNSLLEMGDEFKDIEITNSEIFSLKEWMSCSKERRDSIATFVLTTINFEDVVSKNIEYDKTTVEYIAKQGLLKVIKGLIGNDTRN